MRSNFFKAHRIKFLIGAPIIFLILINSSYITGGNILTLKERNGIFYTVGDEIFLDVYITSKTGINAAGGTVLFPASHLEITKISRETSIIDLWTEDPSYSNTDGKMHFSGGLFDANTEEGTEGTVLTLNMRPKTAGKATLTIIDAQLLANDGQGTNVLTTTGKLDLYIREAGTPSPDTNEDGALSLSDVNTTYLKTFRAYDKRYDMNNDGKVSFADVRVLLSLF